MAEAIMSARELTREEVDTAIKEWRARNLGENIKPGGD